jgi:C1A family cysteine protease
LDPFKEYITSFLKNYSEAEFEERLAAFMANKKLIDEINENKDGKRKFKAGLNHFSDMSPVDFKRKYTGYVKSSAGTGFLSPQAASGLSDGKLISTALSASNLPASVDWVAAGAVTPVKQQGQCGSCWAFSATGAIEGAMKIKTNTLTSLSEEELLECTGSTTLSCRGGNAGEAFDWVKVNGLDSEVAYPYTSGDGLVGAKCLATRQGQAIAPRQLYAIKEVQYLQDVIYAVAQQPVSIAMDASAQEFQQYQSGIWDICGGAQPDHAVLLVGYGSENNQDYWLVKNSWGTSWGEDGYFKMQRGSGTTDHPCTMIYEALYPMVTGGNSFALPPTIPAGRRLDTGAAVRSWNTPGFFVLLLQLFVLHFFFKRR